MKYAFVTFSCEELELDDLLKTAGRHGYDGIEPRVGCGHKHGIELEASSGERQAIVRRFREHGLNICCLGTSCEYVDPQAAPAQIELTKRYVDLASDIGAPLVKMFCGELPKGTMIAGSISIVADSLREVAVYAASKGIVIVVETHDSWSDPEHMAELMRLVDHPSVKVLWDVMHTQREGFKTMEQAYRILKPWIAHVHIHDGLTRLDQFELRTIGAGEFDHLLLLRLLHCGGYCGYLSGEWINWDHYDLHLPRELAAMKRLERQLASETE